MVRSKPTSARLAIPSWISYDLAKPTKNHRQVRVHDLHNGSLVDCRCHEVVALLTAIPFARTIDIGTHYSIGTLVVAIVALTLVSPFFAWVGKC
jgi:hypothetical protein